MVVPDVVLPGKHYVRPTYDRTGVLRLWDAEGRVLTVDDNTPGGLQETGTLGIDHVDAHPLYGGPTRTVSLRSGGTRYAAIDLSIPAMWGTSRTGPLVVGDLQSGPQWTREGRFATVLHAPSDRLWAVEQVDENTVVVWVLDETTGEIVASSSLDDPIGSSNLDLMDIPGRSQVTLAFAGGQDGAAVWELSTDADSIVVRDLFPHDCFTCPEWHPDGDRGLTQNHWWAWPGLLAIVTYADLMEGQCHSISYDSLTTDDTQPWGTGENAHPGVCGPWLVDGSAIIEMGGWRFWRFDPETMRGLDEIVVEGWEPQPSRHDTSLVGVVTSWDRVGRWLVAHGKRDDNHATLVFDEQRLVQQLRRD
ncbi:MAG: hypothetical protein FWD11_01630 [Micrococcales bacterium]|nr:hypothetical protein [Micrococcales bacterium]